MWSTRNKVFLPCIQFHKVFMYEYYIRLTTEDGILSGANFWKLCSGAARLIGPFQQTTSVGESVAPEGSWGGAVRCCRELCFFLSLSFLFRNSPTQPPLAAARERKCSLCGRNPFLIVVWAIMPWVDRARFSFPHLPPHVVRPQGVDRASRDYITLFCLVRSSLNISPVIIVPVGW